MSDLLKPCPFCRRGDVRLALINPRVSLDRAAWVADCPCGDVVVIGPLHDDLNANHDSHDQHARRDQMIDVLDHVVRLAQARRGARQNRADRFEHVLTMTAKS